MKSKCTFLHESQETLEDEVFQVNIFLPGRMLKGVAVRKERYRISGWLWSVWPKGYSHGQVARLGLALTQGTVNLFATLLPHGRLWEEGRGHAPYKRSSCMGRCQALLIPTAGTELSRPGWYFTDFTQGNSNETQKTHAFLWMSQPCQASEALSASTAVRPCMLSVEDIPPFTATLWLK